MNPTLTDTFRRLLAAHEARSKHVDPVVIALPPDLDPADRDALIDVARGSPSVIVVDHQDLAPLVDHGAYIAHGSPLHDALARLNTALDHLPTAREGAAADVVPFERPMNRAARRREERRLRGLAARGGVR